MVAISTDRYTFRYDNKKTAALTDCSFKIMAGEIVLVAGDSGSGKSTLMKSINGLIGETVEGHLDGKLHINNRDMTDLPIYEKSREIGSVFQNPRSQFFTLNSTSEMVFAMENYGFSKGDMDDSLKRIGRELPIGDIMDREILTLSSGERQLLALASAMVLNPGILVFDEPSANLDYSNAMKLKKIILKLKAMGKTVIVADHRFFYLNGILDKVLLLEKGALTCFHREADFKGSDYDTRSFNLFNMDLPCRRERCRKLAEPRGSNALKEGEQPEDVAVLSGVGKWNVLNDVNLALKSGEIAVLVGANGAGKTTLARILTGSLKPDRGTVSTRRLPFYVMQDSDFQLFGTSVESELSIGNKTIQPSEKEKILKRLNLWEYRHAHPFDLSGGEKQRLQIAVAALSKTDLIILDEPTSGLDLKSMGRVVGEVEALAEEKAVLIISHDYEFIRRVADRIIYLKEGRVINDFAFDEKNIESLNNIFIDMEEENEQES
ncbi:energy-coupling factor transport system ATP-binding protein [Peptostreptococcaceae bacterium pGA-8]|nr:energy-coupling factor transport system ATP-binding protein [Peptostreptococcaceae bacterium pGA-8]